MNIPFFVGASVELGLSLPALSVVKANSQQLVPPFRTPYLIKEIRFFSSLYGVSSTSYKFNEVNISVGHRSLTYGFTPICMLCPMVQLATDEATTVIGTFGNSPLGMFRWVLPKPMYVRAGDGLEVLVRNFQQTSSPNNAPLEIIVVGEVLPPNAPVPETTCIPWVSNYKATGQTNGIFGASASTSLELYNPWPDKILNMQRFIGRGFLQTATTTIQDPNYFSTVVSMKDSDKQAILPVEGVFFEEAFDVRTGCLEHRRPLAPKGYFSANLWNIYTASTYTTYYHISMIGWREESIT